MIEFLLNHYITHISTNPNPSSLETGRHLFSSMFPIHTFSSSQFPCPQNCLPKHSQVPPLSFVRSSLFLSTKQHHKSFLITSFLCQSNSDFFGRFQDVLTSVLHENQELKSVWPLSIMGQDYCGRDVQVLAQTLVRIFDSSLL